MLKSIARRSSRNRHISFDFHSEWLILGGNLALLAVFLFADPVARFVRSSDSDLKSFGAVITDAGNSTWIFTAVGVLFLQALKQQRSADCRIVRYNASLIMQAASYIILTVALAGLTSNMLKWLFGRARPALESAFSFFPFEGGHVYASFPSGHATTIGAIMMSLYLLAPALRLPVLVLALWLGFSRVMVGAHYPSDVIAGLTLGAWFALLLATLFARYGFLFKHIGKEFPRPRTGLRVSGRADAAVQLSHSLWPERVEKQGRG